MSAIDVTPACQCGALVHPGESCEAALACLEAMLGGCICGGHYDIGRRVVEHDVWCDLVAAAGSDAPIYWPPQDVGDCECGFGCPPFLGCRYREDEHDGAHVFAGPCEVAS